MADNCGYKKQNKNPSMLQNDQSRTVIKYYSSTNHILCRPYIYY
jgi:hypothetical protein